MLKLVGRIGSIVWAFRRDESLAQKMGFLYSAKIREILLKKIVLFFCFLNY